MFFDKKVFFRLRTEEYNIIMKYVKNNPDIESLSHLARVAIMQYINREK